MSVCVYIYIYIYIHIHISLSPLLQRGVLSLLAPATGGKTSGVNRGQREHKGSLRDSRNKNKLLTSHKRSGQSSPVNYPPQMLTSIDSRGRARRP